MKRCPRCSESLPKDMFGKRKQSKDGLDSWCKPCRTAHHRAWVALNKERYLTYAAPVWKASNARWRAACATRAFGGYKDAILEIYKNCPEGFHVDHIVPLKGKLVSGLHVPWNLQYLPASENLKKSNSFSS